MGSVAPGSNLTSGKDGYRLASAQAVMQGRTTSVLIGCDGGAGDAGAAHFPPESEHHRMFEWCEGAGLVADEVVEVATDDRVRRCAWIAHESRQRRGRGR